ncbi:MAG: hypothetical protein RIS47_790, partial [Bacteroidota bacterium]
MNFLELRFLDVIDIFLVAFLLYQLYMLTKGTVAINIFAGLIGIYLIWLLVKALNMQLLGLILGQVMGVGVIALIIVFQQEIRNFLIIIGTKYLNNKTLSIEHIFATFIRDEKPKVKIASIVKACKSMATTKTGALIVIERESNLDIYVTTGDRIQARTSSRLLEAIFFKNSPLHDGGVIIRGDEIWAARCVLPVTSRHDIPAHMGLRHRAAIGVSENTDAL